MAARSYQQNALVRCNEDRSAARHAHEARLRRLAFVLVVNLCVVWFNVQLVLHHRPGAREPRVQAAGLRLLERPLGDEAARETLQNAQGPHLRGRFSCANRTAGLPLAYLVVFLADCQCLADPGSSEGEG